MKILDYCFAALLAWVAILQINDPDPVYWVTVYALGALIALLNAFSRPAPLAAAVNVGMIMTGVIYAAPGFLDYLAAGDFGALTQAMDAGLDYVEPAREFLGLAIALGIVGSYSWRWRTA
jgi:hypothetical protein